MFKNTRLHIIFINKISCYLRKLKKILCIFQDIVLFCRKIPLNFYLSFLVKTAENGRLRAQSRATRAINTHGKHHPAHLKPGAALDMKVLSLAMTPFPGLDWD